jgi:5'-nucleotidase
MDGTLLDLRYDNYFWQEHLPRRYAERNGLLAERAKEELLGRYNAAKGTLQWYCVDYWTRELGLDIAELKREINHMVKLRPSALDFLIALRSGGKRCVLLTNAHRASVELKFECTGLHPYFDRIISSHDFGEPKETPGFWLRLAKEEPHEPEATLLIDDSHNVLEAARMAGIGHILCIAQPDSGRPEQPSSEFSAISDFRQLLPIA